MATYTGASFRIWQMPADSLILRMRFLTADKIFDGRRFLPEATVLILDEQNGLKELTSEDKLDHSKIEKLKGIITPGFVNAHCHLELSHLKDAIPKHTGLPGFAKQVVSLRHTLAKNGISEQMQQADAEMWDSGIVAVGDISNTNDSFEQKRNSRIYYHTFIEILGLNPVNAQTILNKGQELEQNLFGFGLPGSLAPHAPYSSSKELIALIAEHNSKNKLPLSIHNQESEEEAKFMAGEPNGFEDLYRSLGLDLSWFTAPGMSSLEYYREALPELPSLLVHNTFTSFHEIQDSARKPIFWCFCPSANSYIENKFPDFDAFSGNRNKICIGTDSLASNSNLDLIKEANLILEETKTFSIEDILRALTYNGAAALGISENFGQLKIGKNTGLNLIQTAATQLKFIKKIA